MGKRCQHRIGGHSKNVAQPEEVMEVERRAARSLTQKRIAIISRKGKGRVSGVGGDGAGPPTTKETRGMKQHKDDPFLREFTEYLPSRSGRKKSMRHVRSSATNVSKYVFWCDNEKLDQSYLTWSKCIKR